MSCLNFLSSSMLVFQLAHLAVHLDAREAVRAQLREELAVLALAAAHDGRDHAEARALLQLGHLVHDLLDALPGDGPAAVGAVRVAHARVEQAQVVVDLGDRAHRGARVARGGLLVDGDGRREALDGVHVRLVHLPQELARVGRQRLHVAALPLGVDGVKGQRRLARAGEAGDDDEAVPRQAQGDVLEVVLAGAGDDEIVGHVLSVTDVATAGRRAAGDGRSIDEEQAGPARVVFGGQLDVQARGLGRGDHVDAHRLHGRPRRERVAAGLA